VPTVPELPPSRETTKTTMDQRYPPALTFEETAKEVSRRTGEGEVLRNDPAFGPVGDPVQLPGSKATAKIFYRDNPLVVVQNSWSVQDARSALASHMMGYFEKSAQLADSLIGDDRVTATLGSLRPGYFGREVVSKPANDSRAAKEVHDAWMDHWPQYEGRSDLALLSDYERIMGFADAQVVWDTRTPIWKPYLKHWNARYSYFNWDVRKFVALSQDGPFAIIPGNGKWVHHSRFGYERCWIRGAVRPIAEPYLGRHWAYRDWCRWSEKHGLPTELAETPMAADPTERSQFVAQLANRGSEATILLGKGVDKDNSYDYRLVEAVDGSWEGFPGLRSTSDTAIVLALMFQNLTTEVSEGALASTSEHMDIRRASLRDDNVAWRTTTREQVTKPFAYFNFGDADLAPWVERDMADRDEQDANSKKFQAFGTGMQSLATAGIKFISSDDVRRFARTEFGLRNLPDFMIGDPPSKKPDPMGGDF
jgi:hypothetical protein